MGLRVARVQAILSSSLFLSQSDGSDESNGTFVGICYSDVYLRSSEGSRQSCCALRLCELLFLVMAEESKKAGDDRSGDSRDANTDRTRQIANVYNDGIARSIHSEFCD